MIKKQVWFFIFYFFYFKFFMKEYTYKFTQISETFLRRYEIIS